MYLCILTQKGISERELKVSNSVHGVHDIAEKCSGMWRHLWSEKYFPLAQKMKPLWCKLHCCLPSSFPCFA